jgi:hypothetical protein
MGAFGNFLPSFQTDSVPLHSVDRICVLFIVYLTMLSVGQFIAYLYCLQTKLNNRQYRGWFIVNMAS